MMNIKELPIVVQRLWVRSSRNVSTILALLFHEAYKARAISLLTAAYVDGRSRVEVGEEDFAALRASSRQSVEKLVGIQAILQELHRELEEYDRDRKKVGDLVQVISSYISDTTKAVASLA